MGKNTLLVIFFCIFLVGCTNGSILGGAINCDPPAAQMNCNQLAYDNTDASHCLKIPEDDVYRSSCVALSQDIGACDQEEYANFFPSNQVYSKREKCVIQMVDSADLMGGGVKDLQALKDLCYTLDAKGSSARDECLSDIAEYSKDIEICGDVTKPSYTSGCVTKVAVILEDPGLCFHTLLVDLKDKWNNNHTEICLRGYAEETRSTDVCDQIVNTQRKSQCIEYVESIISYDERLEQFKDEGHIVIG